MAGTEAGGWGWGWQVCGGSVPAVPESPLEVPEDGGQQAVRVHARNAPGRAGKGGPLLGALSQ